MEYKQVMEPTYSNFSSHAFLTSFSLENILIHSDNYLIHQVCLDIFQIRRKCWVTFVK